MSPIVTTVRVEVIGDGPSHASRFAGVATRRAKASVREGSAAIRDEIKRQAQPSRKSGAFQRLLFVDPVVRVGDTFVGGVTANADHSNLLEDGRGAVKNDRPMPIRLPGGKVIFRMSAKPAKGRHYVALGEKAAEPEVRAISEKWAAAIAADLRGRVG